jgi:hypothetical protein
LKYSDKRAGARADKCEPEADGPRRAFCGDAGRCPSALCGEVLHAPDKSVPNDPGNQNEGYEDDRRRMTGLLRQNEKETDDEGECRPRNVGESPPPHLRNPVEVNA